MGFFQWILATLLPFPSSMWWLRFSWKHHGSLGAHSRCQRSSLDIQPSPNYPFWDAPGTNNILLQIKKPFWGNVLLPALLFWLSKGLQLQFLALQLLLFWIVGSPCVLCGELCWLYQPCNDSDLLGHSTGTLALFLEVVIETVGFCFRA